MKKQEFQSLKQKTDKELKEMLSTLKKEINKLRLEMALRKVKNVSSVGQKKKDVARILTVLKERKLKNG
jgi:large subunit ribosomal protein L29